MHARSKTGAGFTIVEVLIVLAVSGLMFVLAINAMSGQQQNTEFQTGLGTLKSQLNADLTNVSDGNYGFLNGVSCSAAATGVPSYNAPNTPPDGSCTVVGEILSFNTKSYEILPVIGRNYISGSTSNQVATNIAQAMPQVSASETETVSMPFGLQVADVSSASIYSPSGPGAFGLFSFTSFEGNSSATAGNSLSSGAEHVEIFMIPSSAFNNPPVGIVNAGITDDPTVCGANNVCTASPPIATEPIDPTAGITFCVNSGTNNDSAMFTIGGTNSATSASDKIYGNPNCT
jgi:type II secretory pathway pseudopilin PulG